MLNIKEFFINRKKLIIRLSLLLVALIILFFSDYGFIKRIDLLIDRSKLTTDINRLKYEKDSLTRRIKNLETDSLEIERIARENYGMTKPNEKIYIITKKDIKK